ncbi:hypothetical protein JXJ21_12615 [candidate division KSB1 bacterium]|nr:hypothetical protein [candidate division KSB1 bacterium]
MKAFCKLATLFLLVVMQPMSFSQTEEPISLAVLALDATGIDVTVAETITEYLRDQLRLESRLSIMHREEILGKLAERTELIGPFTENDEILRVGQLIGTQWVVAGSIVKVGDFFTITLKAFSVETSTSFEISDDHTGTKDSFQYETIENVARQIVEKIFEEIDQKPESLLEQQSEDTKPARWYKKWWVWASAAGGVAIVSSAAILAGSNGNNPSPGPTPKDEPLPIPPDLP